MASEPSGVPFMKMFFFMKWVLINLWNSIRRLIFIEICILSADKTLFPGGLAVLMSRAGGVGGSMGRGGGGGDIFKVGRSPAKKVNKVCSSPHSSINRFHTARRLSSPIRLSKKPRHFFISTFSFYLCANRSS